HRRILIPLLIKCWTCASLCGSGNGSLFLIMPAAAQKKMAPGLQLSTGDLRRRIESFLEDYLRDRSPETVGTYRRSLNEFERWFALQRGRFRFAVADVEAYKRYLMETRELSQVSVSTYLTALRRFSQYLVDIGQIGRAHV